MSTLPDTAAILPHSSLPTSTQSNPTQSNPTQSNPTQSNQAHSKPVQSNAADPESARLMPGAPGLVEVDSTQCVFPGITEPRGCTPKSRLRVCHVSLTLCTGGLERLLVDFARFHDRARFECLFVALDSTGTPAEEIRRAGCEVIRIPLQKLGRLQRVRTLAAFFRERQIDVVHTHNAFPHWYATLAARWAGVPSVIHTRHGRRFGDTLVERMQFRLASWLADCVVGVSADTTARVRDIGWFSAANMKARCICNGIDLDRFPYAEGTSEPVGITVSRLSPEKDLPTLLRAVAEVVRDVPDFQLRIVGDGPERARLETLAAELGIARCVEFLGERSDVSDLLRGAGFYVSSSLTEGISLTVLEAMATGLPVVTTRVGGNPEIVEAGVTGELVPSADPAALASTMREMCDRRAEWKLMGAAARARVESCFNVRTMVADYESMYREQANRTSIGRASTIADASSNVTR